MCVGTGDLVESDTTRVYKTSTSVEMHDGDAFALIQYEYTFAANTCYQISWCHSGDTGGQEDLAVYVSNAAQDDYYNWATDAWQAGAAISSYNNITAAWTCNRLFLSTGVATKTDYLVRLYTASAGDTIYVDNFLLEPLNSCTVDGQLGISLSVPVDSDPVWGHSEVLMPRVGTGPAYKSGMQTDGVDDRVTRADDGTFDPAANTGHFSFGCRFFSSDMTNASGIIEKDDGAANRNWRSFTGTGNDLFFVWWDTTGTQDGISYTNNLAQDAMVSYVATYEYLGDAVSNAFLYSNNETPVTTATAEGPIRNNPQELAVGSSLVGQVRECAYWNKTLSAIEASKWNNPYYPGTNHGDGFYVDTCTHTIPHATCSLQKCSAGARNACQPEGTGALASFSQQIEIVVDNSGESPAGGDDSPNWPDWVETETAGDGTSAITAYRADTKHADLSFRLRTTGTTSEAQIDQCIACSSSTDYYAYGSFKEVTGNVSTLDFYVEEYSGASCATLVTTNYIAQDQDVPEGSWTEYGDTFETGGTTVSCKVVILSDSAGDILVDTVSMKAKNIRTPWVENPTGAGTTSYSVRTYYLNNPMAEWFEADGEYGWENGFCVSFWVYLDYSSHTVNPRFIEGQGTGGNNNLWYIYFKDDELLRFRYYSGAGALTTLALQATDVNFTAGDWKYIEGCNDNAGNMAAHHYNRANATWYDWGSSAASGIMDDAGGELRVSWQGDGAIQGYFAEIRISPYETPFPNKGFNGGVPPVNGTGDNRRPY
jgi:hypothetical protein